VCVAALLAGAGLGSGASAPAAQPAATPVKVADRTILCTPSHDPIPVFTINAQAGHRLGTRMEWLGQLTIWTRGDPLPRHTQDYRPTLIGATGGWPPPPRISSGGVGADLELCRLVRATVPFTKQGLKGGPASDSGDAHKCFPTKTVYMRFRSVFHTKGTVKFDAKRTWIGAIGRIDRTQIAVRTPKGKPLVYGEVLDSGKVILFLEPETCF
jgi:hypothetical protein